MDFNFTLYRELLEFSKPKLLEFFKNRTLQERQFIFDEISEFCYKIMYYSNNTIQRRQDFFNQIRSLKKICSGCYNYYMDPRNKSIKKLDVILGQQFEYLLIDFLKIKKGINSEKADKINKNYPDNLIKDNDGNIICYYEVKFLTAPFLLTYKVRPGRECYEGSTTLDIAKKIKAQRDIIEKLDKDTYYVYWLDYPCIKGVFFWEAEKVFRYLDKVKIEWDRKEREGDFKDEKKIAITKKIYLPLLKMHPFSALYYIFKNDKLKAIQIIKERERTYSQKKSKKSSQTSMNNFY